MSREVVGEGFEAKHLYEWLPRFETHYKLRPKRKVLLTMNVTIDRYSKP